MPKGERRVFPILGCRTESCCFLFQAVTRSRPEHPSAYPLPLPRFLLPQGLAALESCSPEWRAAAWKPGIRRVGSVRDSWALGGARIPPRILHAAPHCALLCSPQTDLRVQTPIVAHSLLSWSELHSSMDCLFPCGPYIKSCLSALTSPSLPPLGLL